MKGPLCHADFDDLTALLREAEAATLLLDDTGTVLWANAAAGRDWPALARAGLRLPERMPGLALAGRTAHKVPWGADEARLLPLASGWAATLPAPASALSLRQVIDAIAVPLFWKDEAGIYRGCNPAMAAILGRPAEEIVGRSLAAVSGPDLAAKYAAMDEALMAEGPGGTQRYEWEVAHKDGSRRQVLFCKANIPDAQGRVRGLVGTVLDITDLRQAERKFSQLFNLCPAVITLTDRASGRYLEVNDAFVTVTGHSRAEAIGSTALGIGIWGEETDRAAVLAALAANGGRLTNFETRFRRRDGSVFPALIACEGITLVDRSCLILVGWDISAQKENEARLTQAVAALTRSNADLEQFAYVASHDLRDPLRTISLYIGMMQRRLAASADADLRDFMAFARDGAKRMDRMVLDLLDYSRAGRAQTPPGAVPMAEVIEAALAILAVRIEESGAVIQGPAEDALVLGRRDDLLRLMQNLLANALKYRDPERSPRIAITARRQGGDWLFAVEDNGIGIDPAYHERIFQVFQRLHTRAEYDGTGIGLAICRRIVQERGGRLWVEPAPQQGSRFLFTLPAA